MYVGAYDVTPAHHIVTAVLPPKETTPVKTTRRPLERTSMTRSKSQPPRAITTPKARVKSSDVKPVEAEAVAVAPSPITPRASTPITPRARAATTPRHTRSHTSIETKSEIDTTTRIRSHSRTREKPNRAHSLSRASSMMSSRSSLFAPPAGPG